MYIFKRWQTSIFPSRKMSSRHFSLQEVHILCLLSEQVVILDYFNIVDNISWVGCPNLWCHTLDFTIWPRKASETFVVDYTLWAGFNYSYLKQFFRHTLSLIHCFHCLLVLHKEVNTYKQLLLSTQNCFTKSRRLAKWGTCKTLLRTREWLLLWSVVEPIFFIGKLVPLLIVVFS